ncbi:MAG TPA: adventurous gliding motility lipoprotein CglC [Anaeromyxobacteraceae bacterium]|jgi:hypothetical protein|nr:adventurous gliding motility lipoprotein CglC [Anaeromyxobacteraceae bacterium]
MGARSFTVRLAATLAGALLACQPPDVGQACPVRLPAQNGVPVSCATVQGDYLETGVTACENLVCIVSPTNGDKRVTCNPGYCSKPCVSDADCDTSSTGLVCRQVVLDPAFLASIPTKYLGDLKTTYWCAIPQK